MPKEARRNGEQVLWEGAAAVSSAALVDDALYPIDTAGVDLGFLIVTTQQVVVGHRKRRRLRGEVLEVWERLDRGDIEAIEDHPMGVAFVIGRFGPVDLIICAPSRNLDELAAAVSRFWVAG